MSEPASPPAASAPAPKKKGILRTAFIWFLGLGGGAVGTYVTAVFNTVIKPPLPVANFAVSVDGLTVTCQNHATGDNGWWDFGDGSPLEPFSSDAPAVTHVYTKPGSYSVKLTVRNLTSDENDRSVSVEVSPGTRDAPATPQIAAFAVQPVSPATMAPATFRVTADVQNAEHVVWDLGDGRVEVAEGGKIDRLVTFDKPGSFPVQLVAHNGKAAAKQSSAVKVDAPPDGTLVAIVTVTDGGTQINRATRQETLAIPAPRDKNLNFSRNVWAKPGFTLVDVVTTKPDVQNVKNLKLTIATDKRSAAISGEWAAAPDGKSHADALVPLKITEERASNKAASSMQATGLLTLSPNGKASVAIPLPPLAANTDAVSRKIDVEIRQMGPGGKQFVVASGPLVGRGPVSIPAKNVYSPPAAAITTASYDIATVKVNFEINQGATAGR
jgi:PKD repeat protein